MKAAFSWLLTHYLDKGKGPYYPYEYGILKSQIRNTGKTRIHISKVGIEFDWMKEANIWWNEDCSVELLPGDSKSLPSLKFRIPIDVEIRSHTYKVGVNTEVLTNSEWESKGTVLGEKTYHFLVSKHPRRDFKVFISHSNDSKDDQLIDTIHNLLDRCGVDAYIAEKRAEPGTLLWSKIEREIRTSDAMVVLWTKTGARSGDVREEIGIAVGLGRYKQIVPIAEVKLQGSLKGKEYASLDRDDPKKAILEAIKTVLEMAEKKPTIPSPTPTI